MVNRSPSLVEELREIVSLKDLLKIAKRRHLSYPDFNLIGKGLMDQGFFNQAYLLFSHGLTQDVPDSGDEHNNPNFHRRFHFDLSDLITLLHRQKLKAKDFGFQPELVRFQFSPEKGFYLPDFDHNVPNEDYKDAGMEPGRERTLMHIHYALGTLEKIDGSSHKNNNCPYLHYCSTK